MSTGAIVALVVFVGIPLWAGYNELSKLAHYAGRIALSLERQDGTGRPHVPDAPPAEWGKR